MLLTRRSLIILASAAIWILIGSLFPPAQIIFILHIGFSLFFIILDYIISPQREDIEVFRHCEKKLSLLDDNPVTIEIINRSGRTIKGAMVDEYPDPGRADPERLEFEIQKKETRELTYRYRPEKRGDVIFRKVHFRIYGQMGFIIKRFSMPVETKAQVYPNLIQTRRWDLLARKGALFAAGFKPIGRYGRGTEFSQLREYFPDDEFRKIDWKASARKGGLVVKEYEIERSQPLALFIDCGRQMIGRIDEHTRLDYAINAALMLAYVAVLKGDQVGLIAFDAKIQHYIAPGRGMAQLNRIIEALYDIQPSEVESDYAGAFKKFLATWRKRSLIALFSDVVDPTASSVLLAHLPSVHPRHLPLAVLLKDPELIELERQAPENSMELYEKAIACDLASSRELASRQLRQAGCLVVDVAPKDLTVSVVNEYLRLKARSMI
ncbi:MAG: DUF58 domain-containing protein [bacterium]|nr:DUF58 domain-containing protein [bacterium]